MKTQPPEILRDLGNGLIVRRGRPEDSEVLAEICLPQLEALFPKALSDVWPVG